MIESAKETVHDESWDPDDPTTWDEPPEEAEGEATEPEPEERATPAPLSRRALWLEMGAVLALSYMGWLYGALAPWDEVLPVSFVDSRVAGLVYDLQICLPLLFILWRSGEPWSRFGIGRPQWMNDPIIGVVIFLAVTLVPRAIFNAFFSGWYSGWPRELEKEVLADTFLLPSGPAEQVLLIVGLALAAFNEELVCRGYLIPRLRQLGAGAFSAVLVSSLLFGSFHLYYGPWSTSLICVEGLVYGALFLATGRLWPVVIAHTLFNLNVYDWAAAG